MGLRVGEYYRIKPKNAQCPKKEGVYRISYLSENPYYNRYCSFSVEGDSYLDTPTEYVFDPAPGQ